MDRKRKRGRAWGPITPFKGRLPMTSGPPTRLHPMKVPSSPNRAMLEAKSLKHGPFGGHLRSKLLDLDYKTKFAIIAAALGD
jgi:hypothetical protein